MAEQNRILYDEACPNCKAEGREAKLFLDMDRVEIRCEAGHVFEELPSDVLLRTGQAQDQVATAEPLQVERVEPLQVEAIPAEPGDSGEQISEENPVVSETPLSNTLEEAMTAEAGTERLAEIATELPSNKPATDEDLQPIDAGVAVSGTSDYGLSGVVRLNRVDTGTSQYLVSEGQAVNLPNGDLLLGIVIPEVWKSAVESEAESQLKSPATYFRDWLTSEEMRQSVIEWLENYWVSSYSQRA